VDHTFYLTHSTNILINHTDKLIATRLKKCCIYFLINKKMYITIKSKIIVYNLNILEKIFHFKKHKFTISQEYYEQFTINNQFRLKHNYDLK